MSAGLHFQASAMPEFVRPSTQMKALPESTAILFCPYGALTRLPPVSTSWHLNLHFPGRHPWALLPPRRLWFEKCSEALDDTQDTTHENLKTQRHSKHYVSIKCFRVRHSRDSVQADCTHVVSGPGPLLPLDISLNLQSCTLAMSRCS